MADHDHDFCGECGEQEEIVEHILGRCPALENSRFQTLGPYYLHCLEEAGELDIHLYSGGERSLEEVKITP